MRILFFRILGHYKLTDITYIRITFKLVHEANDYAEVLLVFNLQFVQCNNHVIRLP